ncbi:TetR/AcrR family transcriptional regulator [Streptomyces xiaopingdaonensis]|uniref:TetR/AcrR family transcriptional regulator n=1 Tax=Streptomyces xiaopingdaonensis TaxID=1565415 RepID=UPI00036416E5|nr:TetR/AcrR family transcriptional regulator [Streptomyces xiaopingdaonensis]
MPEKRRAIVRAARAVFGREGFTGASVDVIAAEGEVSKRTVYNHFTDKESLFQAVVLEGAREVARSQAVLADRHLHKIVDLEQDLVAFSLDRVATLEEFADHWALVRVIEAEAARIRPVLLEEWQQAGPWATIAELTRWISELADRGHLATDDPARAANHLNLLTFIAVAQPTFYGALPMSRRQVTTVVAEGVETFLHSYAAPAG